MNEEFTEEQDRAIEEKLGSIANNIKEILLKRANVPERIDVLTYLLASFVASFEENMGIKVLDVVLEKLKERCEEIKEIHQNRTNKS